jgi:hypothetical protein
MDMRFHWLRCHEAQHQFCFYWAPGKSNLGDYWTKHHCVVHHIEKTSHHINPGGHHHSPAGITPPQSCPPNCQSSVSTAKQHAQQFSHQPTTQNTGKSSRTQETPQNRRAQIITRETKTSKNRQKLLKRRAQKLRMKQNFQKSPKIAELEGTINTPSEGTKNYAQNKTSENRQYYVRNKTSKNLQKIAKLEGIINTPPSEAQQNNKQEVMKGCSRHPLNA